MEIVEVSTQRQLEEEALVFVKDGWTMFKIKIKLFDEAEFDEEIKHLPRHLDQVSHRWKEPDPHELMRVEGLSFNDVFLLQRSSSAEGRGKSREIPYKFILNKYKYFATYEVCLAKPSPLLRGDLHFCFTVQNTCIFLVCEQAHPLRSD